MGSTSSKEKQKGGVYAEIVSGKEDEAIPPLKVFINAQITSTAVDSLKDAHEMMYLLAENLIMEALKDGQTPKMFGQMLKHMLAYESTQCTTRQFLYWSMHSPHGYDNIRHISAWHMKDYINTYAPIQLSVAAQEWSLSLLSRRTVINPLLTWTLNHEDIVVGPLADIVKDTLPHTRESVTSGLKHVITENLKSETVKTTVKSAIVEHLSKIGRGRGANKVPEPGAGEEAAAPAVATVTTASEGTAEASTASR